MRSRSVISAGICAAAMTAVSAVAPALAENTLQGFICDSRGSVVFQNPTSKDKRYVIPSIDRVASLVDAQAQGPVGIVYNIDPPQPFRFIQWYYKEARDSNALRGVTVKFCVQRADGTGKQSYSIQGGTQDRGGPVGDGWSQVVQDNRGGIVPSIVLNGEAFLTKLTYVFKDKKNTGENITLGRVSIQPGNIDVQSLITDIGGCSLKDGCNDNVLK